MPKLIYLASLGLDGLPEVLDEPASFLQLLYVPTARNVDATDFASDEARAALADMGFQIDDLDIATASADRVRQSVAACDVVYVGGGNTYYLLDCVNRSGFRDALAVREDVVYVGASAGAVIASPDIAYIGNADDRSAAPKLESTIGLGLVDISVLPHDNVPQFGALWDRIPHDAGRESSFVRLNDDQAVVVRDGKHEIIAS